MKFLLVFMLLVFISGCVSNRTYVYVYNCTGTSLYLTQSFDDKDSPTTPIKVSSLP